MVSLLGACNSLPLRYQLFLEDEGFVVAKHRQQHMVCGTATHRKALS
jgi:hypothetical protein